MQTDVPVINLAGLLIVWLTLRATLLLVYGRQSAMPGDQIHLLLIIVTRVVGVGFIIGVIFLFVGVLSLLLGVAALVIWAASANRKRMIQQHSLLHVIAVTTARGIPLEPTLHEFANEEAGVFGRRVQVLERQVRQGFSLPDAAEQASGALPARGVVALQVGSYTGDHSAAVNDALLAEVQQQPLVQLVLGRFFYLAMIFVAFGLVGTFVMLKIVPQYQAIFLDFGTQLPTMTRLAVVAAELIVDSGLAALLTSALLMALFYLTLQYIGWLPWSLLPMGWLMWRFDISAILRSLALCTERGLPLVPLLELLARSYPHRKIRVRLRRIMADISAGNSWHQSLARRGLVRKPDAAVLESAQRAGNVAWALRETADGNLRRTRYRIDAALQVLFPLAIVCLGAVVALFVIGLFLPLVQLIKSMS